MSAYLNNSIDSENYQKNRVTYPKSLYEEILKNHHGERNLAVDVGCGTGIGTLPLLAYFKRVVGCDPSEKMLQTAERVRNQMLEVSRKRIEFVKAEGESLSEHFGNNSVDLITAGECIQYAKHDIFFEQCHNVLRAGGTLAYWFYCDPIFVDYPEANEIFKHYVYEDKHISGFLWPPEMEYVRKLGANIIIPEDMFENVESEVYIPLKTPDAGSFLISRDDYTLKDFRKNMSTWGVYQTWLDNNSAAEQDIIDFIIRKIKSTCGISEDTTLRVQWETAFYIARNKK